MGGFNGTHPLATVEAYFPALDRWVPVASMLTSRNAHAAAVVDTYIYVVGGQEGRNPPFLNSTERYDPVQNQWISREPMPMQLAGLAAAAMSGSLYVVGGALANNDSTLTFVGTALRFNPNSNSWTVLPSLKVARANLALFAVPTGSPPVIYAVGGQGSSITRPEAVEAYSVENNTWATVGNETTVARKNPGCAMIM